MNRTPILFLLSLFFCTVLTGASVMAEDSNLKEIELPPIESTKIVLTIITPAGGKKYTIADIERIGMKQIRTSTYWPEDDGVYQGILLKDLLDHAGIGEGKGIRLTALDDYAAEIPKQDWEKWPVLIATRKDGKPMSVRRKGPTRIIYPKYMGGAVAESPMRIKWIWAIKKIEAIN